MSTATQELVGSESVPSDSAGPEAQRRQIQRAVEGTRWGPLFPFPPDRSQGILTPKGAGARCTEALGHRASV